jgi:hypothetical protein
LVGFEEVDLFEVYMEMASHQSNPEEEQGEELFRQ